MKMNSRCFKSCAMGGIILLPVAEGRIRYVISVLAGGFVPAIMVNDSLDSITNEDEIVYLTVCFMASIRRMKSAPYKRVLLVCGHCSGTTTTLKESLLSKYQIHIMDTIPICKLSA